jgi:hypothetical protein
LVNKLVQDFEAFSGSYLDDLIIFSDTWEEHLKHVAMVLSIIRNAGLTLHLKKCEFANAEIDYLGHHICLGKVMPKQKKVDALLACQRPWTKRQLKNFVGLAAF